MSKHNARRPLFRCVILLAVTSACPALAVESYTVDTSRSTAHFSVSHFWVTTTQGRFDKINGKVTLDRATKNGLMDIIIEAASINTDITVRDKNLRSANFFDVAKFPTIFYQSSAVIFTGDTPTSIQGNLTLLGVTRPVTLTLTAFNCGLQPATQLQRCKADAHTEIKRSDFGMRYGLPLIGDEIKLQFEIETYQN